MAQPRIDDGDGSAAGTAPMRVATATFACHAFGPSQARPIPAPDRLALFSAPVHGWRLIFTRAPSMKAETCQRPPANAPRSWRSSAEPT
jgi:hypothetical protein